MYKLIYFRETWRGEPIRLLFCAAGVDFENVLVTEDEVEWPPVKKTLEWGILPVLQYEGKTMCQGRAICRFLGRKFGMAGADEWEAARCDELVDCVADILEEYIQFVWIEKDKNTRAARRTKFFKATLPGVLIKLDAILKNNGQWLVGRKMTWADIFIVDSIRLLTQSVPKMLDEYRNLKNLYDGVYAIPKIKEFREKQDQKMYAPLLIDEVDPAQLAVSYGLMG